MSDIAAPQIAHVVTANRLSDGEVVFWSGTAWIAPLDQAKVFDTAEDAAPVVADARASPTLLIDPYAIDVRREGGTLVPLSFRERIRALGPSDRTDLGKQAGGGGAIAAIREAHGAARSTGRLGLIRRK